MTIWLYGPFVNMPLAKTHQPANPFVTWRFSSWICIFVLYAYLILWMYAQLEYASQTPFRSVRSAKATWRFGTIIARYSSERWEVIIWMWLLLNRQVIMFALWSKCCDWRYFEVWKLRLLFVGAYGMTCGRFVRLCLCVYRNCANKTDVIDWWFKFGIGANGK